VSVARAGSNAPPSWANTSRPSFPLAWLHPSLSPSPAAPHLPNARPPFSCCLLKPHPSILLPPRADPSLFHRPSPACIFTCFPAFSPRRHYDCPRVPCVSLLLQQPALAGLPSNTPVHLPPSSPSLSLSPCFCFVLFFVFLLLLFFRAVRPMCNGRTQKCERNAYPHDLRRFSRFR